MLAGEQKRHVDRHAGKNRRLDRRQAFLGAGNLDEQVRPPSALVQLLGRRERVLRVVGEQRRNLQRNPAVDAGGELEIGWNRSAARVRSSSARSKNSASPDCPSSSLLRIAAS